LSPILLMFHETFMQFIPLPSSHILSVPTIGWGTAWSKRLLLSVSSTASSNSVVYVLEDATPKLCQCLLKFLCPKVEINPTWDPSATVLNRWRVAPYVVGPHDQSKLPVRMCPTVLLQKPDQLSSTPAKNSYCLPRILGTQRTALSR
jgi:hypothetical protein